MLQQRLLLASPWRHAARPSFGHYSSQSSTVRRGTAAAAQTMLKYLEAMADDEDKETVARACEGFGRLAKLVGPVRR